MTTLKIEGEPFALVRAIAQRLDHALHLHTQHTRPGWLAALESGDHEDE